MTASDSEITIVTCLFCGQTAHVAHAVSQDDADDKATRRCKCYQGADWRDAQEHEERVQRTIISAEHLAFVMVEQDDKKLLVLSEIIEGVAKGYVDAAEVSVSPSAKIKVKRVGVDGISLIKTTTIKESEEV